MTPLSSTASSQTEAGAESRFLLENIRWSTYEALLEDLGDHRGARIAYEEGRLEIMSPSRKHERLKCILGRLLEAYAAVRKIDMTPVGSWTLMRKLLRRGIEPDECYHIQNDAAVRGRDDLDIAVDPPPDLVIEIDISRSSLDRLGIYAAFRIPEVWSYDGKSLRIHHLEPGGKYREAVRSKALPDLPIDELLRFLGRYKEKSAVALAEEFRATLRRR
jgi:Uma2 family endonuclease